MKRIIDCVDGISTFHEYDPVTKETRIWQEGDAEPGIIWARNLSNSDGYTKDGMKKGFWHYCHIPNSVLTKWAAMGVDISRAEALIEMVNKPEWRYLKTTSKTHSAKY